MADLKNISNIRKSQMFHLPTTGIELNIRMYDVFFFVIGVGGAFLVMDNVHPLLRWPFVIYTILLMLFLIISPKSNPGRSHYQLMFSALRTDRRLYRSIEKNDFLEEDRLEDKNGL